MFAYGFCDTGKHRLMNDSEMTGRVLKYWSEISQKNSKIQSNEKRSISVPFPHPPRQTVQIDDRDINILTVIYQTVMTEKICHDCQNSVATVVASRI